MLAYCNNRGKVRSQIDYLLIRCWFRIRSSWDDDGFIRMMSVAFIAYFSHVWAMDANSLKLCEHTAMRTLIFTQRVEWINQSQNHGNNFNLFLSIYLQCVWWHFGLTLGSFVYDKNKSRVTLSLIDSKTMHNKSLSVECRIIIYTIILVELALVVGLSSDIMGADRQQFLPATQRWTRICTFQSINQLPH